MQPDTFAELVRDALGHLYDRPYLQTHPMVPLLLGREQEASADELRRLLLDAIEQLRPPEPCPPTSPVWRRYRYLVLRYVEGAKPENAARELHVSIRQSRREHDHALKAVTSVLWQRRRRLAESQGLAAPPAPAVPPASDRLALDRSAEPGVPAEVSAYEAGDELLKIGSLPPAEPASVAEALCGALGIVARLADLRGARIEAHLVDTLPSVRVHRLVLRQVLIDLLGCAVESHPRALVDVSASSAPQGIGIEVTVPGSSPRGVAQSSGIESRLAACRRLIDDNPDVAYLFARFLRDHGYRVLQANTGEAALQLAREVRPHAITLDVLMPSQDGWDILRALADDPDARGIPVILCSVLPERSLALSLGVADFLSKPVTQHALLASLQRCARIPESWERG